MHFRRGVQRVVILMTDEDPNVAYDPDLEGTTASVAAELAADGVSLFLLVPTGDEYLAIQEITRAARYEIGAAAQGAFGPVLLGIADRLSLQYQVMYRSPDPDRQGGRRARVRVFKPTLWLPAGELPGDEVVAFMADPDEGCRVLAVLATAGIYRSSDCARSWERVEAPDLQYRSAVGNYGADHILYLLTDDGELWTLSGLDGAPLQRDIALPDTEHIAWVESRSHEVWTVSDGRLHVSYDNALGFEPFAVLPSRLLVETLAVDPHVAGRLCGLDDRGAFWCVGAGGAWRTLGFVGSGPGGHVSMCGWRSGLYFVVIDGALFRSIDAGGSWARVEPGAGGRAGRVFQGHQGGVPVLCVSSDTGVSCSDDDGLTWSWIATSGASGRAGWVALRASGGLYWVPAAGGAVSRQAEVTTREFLGSALFDVDEAEPYPDALSLVESLGQTLAANPRLSARVDGHTDSDGDADYNLDLSRRRAESIAAILVSAGARPHQVDAHGYGETRPLFPNDSDENKQANRRVEIVVFQEF